MYKNLAAPGIPTPPAACFSCFIPGALAQRAAALGGQGVFPCGARGNVGTAAQPVTGDLAVAMQRSFRIRAALLDNRGHDVPASAQTLVGAHSLNMNFQVQGVQGKLNHSTPRSS